MFSPGFGQGNHRKEVNYFLQSIISSLKTSTITGFGFSSSNPSIKTWFLFRSSFASHHTKRKSIYIKKKYPLNKELDAPQLNEWVSISPSLSFLPSSSSELLRVMHCHYGVDGFIAQNLSASHLAIGICSSEWLNTKFVNYFR